MAVQKRIEYSSGGDSYEGEWSSDEKRNGSDCQYIRTK